jgi:hypothetical protein
MCPAVLQQFVSCVQADRDKLTGSVRDFLANSDTEVSMWDNAVCKQKETMAWGCFGCHEMENKTLIVTYFFTCKYKIFALSVDVRWCVSSCVYTL